MVLNQNAGRFEQESRREFLKRSAHVGVGLTLTQWLGLSSLFAQPAKAKARSCIVLWMAGGPSQLDTWDPKPGRATGGEFKTIGTAVDGIEISEHLPNVASEMKQLAVIRSMTSREGNHRRARYLAHSGYPPQGPTRHPSLGAIVSKALASKDVELPPFVSLNGPSLGPGLLGVDFAPFVVRDPSRPIENLEYPSGVTQARFDERLALLSKLETEFQTSHRGEEAAGHWTMVEKAVQLMRSPAIDAFDLSLEDQRHRESFGLNPFGQGCLAARRLVERGVRYVEVELGGWDTHQDNFETTRSLMAALDPAMSGLIRDLRERGLLESTLVVWMGEFGRTPKINRRGGRDHYPQVWSVVLAGGGVAGGQVIGATDAEGYEIRERPVTVPDLFASICHSLGIDPQGVNYSSLGRPIQVTDEGKPLPELFGSSTL